MIKWWFLVFVLFYGPVACQSGGQDYPPQEDSHSRQEAATNPQDQFWAQLLQHCGRSYSGEAVLFPERDNFLEGARLVIHFRECSDEVIKVPLHVNEDRSRTWILTRIEGAIDLRHDHRNQDGTEAEHTMYGARTLQQGSDLQQEFMREDPEGAGQGWVIELQPELQLTYGTQRDGEWRHRLDFDLTRTVPNPPPPWGFDRGSSSSH